MRSPVSAALLSAFVFPGAGHLYLRRRARACLFLLPALAALVWFAADITQRVSVLADQVLAGKLPADPVALAARIEAQGGTTSVAGNVCAAVLIVCWLGGIIDSIIVARADARRGGVR